LRERRGIAKKENKDQIGVGKEPEKRGWNWGSLDKVKGDKNPPLLARRRRKIE
jgi:hypothetical protein